MEISRRAVQELADNWRTDAQPENTADRGTKYIPFDPQPTVTSVASSRRDGAIKDRQQSTGTTTFNHKWQNSKKS